MPPTRHGAIVAIIALAVLGSGVGIAAYPITAATQGPQLTLEVTTTLTDAPANDLAYGEQPVEARFEYSGFGSGSHDLRLMEDDAFYDDTLREFTVEGNSGTVTFQLSAQELEDTKESGPETTALLEVRWGEEAESNSVVLGWLDTTVYTKGYHKVPDEVEPGEEVTIEYYGYTNKDKTHVRLVEDDHPHGSSSGGDEQMRRTEVTGPGYFEGTFTFTPSDYIERGNRVLEVQARPADENSYPDLVRTIRVSEPETEIDARITDLSPPAGEYHAGQFVRAKVTVENTGNAQHTFFVGFGVVDESGTTYDNDGTTGTQVPIAPGETETVTVSWRVEDDAPTGTYGVGASVWQEASRDSLKTRLDDARAQNAFEVVAPPDTPTDTESEDASSNDNEPVGDAGADVAGDEVDDAETDEVDDAETDEDGTAPGPMAAITALAAAALLARHRAE